MASGILLSTDQELEAQLGSGSGSGGAVGQGGPEIMRPEKSSDATPEGTMKPDPDSAAIQGSEGAIILQPKPGEGSAPGSGRPPDRSTPNAATKEQSGFGSGSGRIDSSGKTGSSGDKGPSSGDGGTKR